MLHFSITSEPSLAEFHHVLHLEQNLIKKAAVRALNKTARWLRTDISRNTAKELNIKVGLVRNSLRLQRATYNNLESIVSLGKRSGVIKAIDLGNARQNARGVKAGRRQFHHAFIATMNNGHKGVFERKRKPRLPIKELQVVITGQLARQLEYMEDGKGIRQFQKVFERELRFLRGVN